MLGIGGSKSKSKSTSDTTGTSTTTPNNPQWVTDALQGLTGQVGNLAGQDPQSFLAGPSDLQKQQFGLAGQIGGQAGGLFNQATQAAQAAAGYQPQQVAGATAYGGISNYTNPYEEQVVNAGLNDINRSRQMAITDNGRSAVLAGQYGGSRQGVAEGNTNEAALRQAADFTANTRSQGFNTALGAAQQDADRSQQAALANQSAGLAGAGLNLQGGQALGNQALAGYGLLSDAGATQQGLNQQQAGAPLDFASQLAQIYGSLPYGLFQGSTTNGTQSNKSTGSQTGMSVGASFGGK